MSLGRTLILRVSGLPFIERLVRRSRLFRGLVSRFVAGDTVQEAMTNAEQLAEKGLLVTLDLLGENVKSKQEVEAALTQYKALLEAIGNSAQRDRINISIKLTQCGFDLGDAYAEENFRNVLEFAKQWDIFVRVDMESSEYTERTVAMIEKVFADYPNTGTVLQSYLYRTPEDAERMIRLGARVRVVKGAYLEPESVAHKSKHDVDEKYVEVAKALMERGNYPAIATHDERIIAEVKRFAEEKGIPKTAFEFQMLYGIRRDLQDGLRDEGFPVRVYVPYGESWYPYFVRRIAERPANGFFVLKALLKG